MFLDVNYARMRIMQALRVPEPDIAELDRVYNKYGHIFLIENSCLPTPLLTKSLEVAKWFHDHKFGSHVFTPATMHCAVVRDKLELVIWLNENRTEGCFENTYNNNIVKLSTLDEAVTLEKPDILEYLLTSYIRKDKLTLTLHGMMYLLNKNNPQFFELIKTHWPNYSTKFVDELLVSKENQYYATGVFEKICFASRLGNMNWFLEVYGKEILKNYFFKNSSNLVHHNSLDVSKWMHSNEFDIAFSSETMHYAAIKGDMEHVFWLNKNRKEGCREESKKTYKLFSRSIISETTLDVLCEKVDLATFRLFEKTYIRPQKLKIGLTAFLNCARHEKFDFIEYFQENRQEFYTVAWIKPTLKFCMNSKVMNKSLVYFTQLEKSDPFLSPIEKVKVVY